MKDVTYMEMKEGENKEIIEGSELVKVDCFK